VTTIAAAELSGVWPDPATAEALARLSDALPPTADIFAVGAMISRDAGASMRVAMRRLTPDQTFAVLTAMGRPVQAEVLAAWAQHTSAVRQAVALEIGPGAEHRVGLELAPDHDWKRSCLDGWPQLLDELVSQGLAVPARAARVAALVDSSGRPRWGLAHVKIAAGNDGLLPGSKLYVGLLHEDAQ
jgi:hypothetical protein